MQAIERLPIPFGLTYAAIFLLESSLLLIAAWVDGSLPAFSIDPIFLIYPAWLCGPLFIMTHLNSVSRQALSNFRPLLAIPDSSVKRLEYEFTSMPASKVVLHSLAWTAFYLIFTYAALRRMYGALGFGQLASSAAFVAGFASFFVGSAIYYHTIRQLRLVHRTVTSVKEFDLFRLDPVYAFSSLTSRTAIAWVLLLTITLVLFPISLAPGPSLALLVTQLLLAIAAFVLPIRFVNTGLVAAKRRLLAELDARLKATLARLHRCLDENALEGVPHLNGAIAGLAAERDLLSKIPTWPWRPGTFAGFLSIIVLPIALFVVQLLLSRWLAR
jgi:hypothetical protein